MAFKIPVPIPLKTRAIRGQHSTQVPQLLAVELTAKHPICILSRTLESSTDDSPNTGEGDGLDTSVFVAKPAA